MEDRNYKMSKTLFIVGNGFDLAHGLKTTYKDFKNYLENSDYESQQFMQNLTNYITVRENWSDIEEALGLLDYENLCYDNSCYLVSYSDEKFRDSANHDFSYEIEKNLKTSAECSSYLRKWIEWTDKNASPIFNLPKDADYLSFNYTNTLETVYGIPKNKILYIHGDYSKEDDKLIFGHNDINASGNVRLYKEDADVRQLDAEDLIKNYFNDTYKNPNNIIEAHTDFFEKLNSVEEIIIIGESFKTDKDYFRFIKEKVSPNCFWKIAFHDTNDYRNVYSFAKELGLRNYCAFEFVKLWDN